MNTGSRLNKWRTCSYFAGSSWTLDWQWISTAGQTPGFDAAQRKTNKRNKNPKV